MNKNEVPRNVTTNFEIIPIGITIKSITSKLKLKQRYSIAFYIQTLIALGLIITPLRKPVLTWNLLLQK